ncbi:hypothetical protein [Streptomyces sp. CRN 30]|uniref:hypothetical protein n=1 Tax=Streptomyces sp. CRN 30 TaxID=3075613 RepID=UPI002A807282|nr:hypothetical protein [Streptomyces sp. CRN 30]
MASRVPEIIDTLVALAKADPALAGVRVADGPEVTGDSVPDWLVIGFDGDPSGDFEAAQTAGGWSDLATGREEEFLITVAAIANRGDTDIVAARRRAYEIAERVGTWLRTSPDLGLVSLEASVAGTRLVQDQTDQGAQARLLLTVAGRAFT